MNEDSRSVKLSYCLHGLRQAILRLDAAHWHRPEDAFIAAADGLSWAVALDVVLETSNEDGRDAAAYKNARAASEDGKTVIGMKFVRNHVHHAADLLNFVLLGGVVGNSTYGLEAGWTWAPLAELEPLLEAQHTSGKGLYRERLEGQSVTYSLLDALRWFGSLTPSLPDLPPDPSGCPRPDFELPKRWPPVQGDRRI